MTAITDRAHTRQPKRSSDIGNKQLLLYQRRPEKSIGFLFYTLFSVLEKGSFYGLRQKEKNNEILVRKKSSSIRPRIDQISG